MQIDLDSLFGLPLEFQNRLRALDYLFIESNFLENFENNADVKKLISDLNEFCLKNRVIGYHYTRAFPNDFKEKGMLSRTGNVIREEFKKRHFHLFSKKEQIQITEEWYKSFGKDDNENRDNRIFFNFTLSALNWKSAELLLKYYGGEQVYAPIYRLPGIGKKLCKIGEPLILKCDLNPNDIKTYIINPWGKIIMSSYHRTKNSEAHTIDQDGNQKVRVKAENIEIIKLTKHYC